jgi:hypothetical protein
MPTGPVNLRASVSVTFRWWVAPYCKALEFFCLLMGTEPDPDKLADLLTRRGVKVSIRME